MMCVSTISVPGFEVFFGKEVYFFFEQSTTSFPTIFLQYRVFVQRLGGIAQADLPQEVFIWNFATWLSIIVKLKGMP